MELEELKNMWSKMDDRLKKSESLKETIILELIRTKTSKCIDKLINWEVFGLVILILLIPFIAYSYIRFGGHYLAWDLVVILAEIVSFISCFWIAYKIRTLTKIDFSKIVSDNIIYINRYNIQINREWMIFNIFLGPVLAILMIVTYIEMNVSSYLWFFLISILVSTSLFTYWSYKRTRKNIELVIKSLDEIRELEQVE